MLKQPVALLMLAVFIMLGGTSLIASAQGIPFMLKGHTTSMEPVDIVLRDKNGEVSLRIPKAYLVKVKNWFGGEQDSVFMQAVLPDLRPVQKEDLDRTKSLPPIISIWLDGYAGEKGDKYVLSELKELAPYCVPTKYNLCMLSDAYFEASEIPGKVPPMGFGPGDDHYFTTKGKRYILIACEKKNAISCKNRTNPVPRISGRYSFDSAMFPEKWEEIDDKVNKLIEKFVVSEKAAN